MTVHPVNLLEITEFYARMLNFIDCNYATQKTVNNKREKTVFSMIFIPSFS